MRYQPQHRAHNPHALRDGTDQLMRGVIAVSLACSGAETLVDMPKTCRTVQWAGAIIMDVAGHVPGMTAPSANHPTTIGDAVHYFGNLATTLPGPNPDAACLPPLVTQPVQF